MYHYNFKIFNSPCQLIFDAPTKASADAISRSIYQYAKKLETNYSFFSEVSELYLLNHRKTNRLMVSDELAGLLAIAAFYYEKTSSAFDIAYAGTMYDCLQTASLKEYQQTKEALLPYATFSHIHLDGNNVEFSNKHTQLDLGGFVKEYAVDQAILRLKQLNIPSALVDFGGDVAAYGNHAGAQWCIGIQDPKQNENNLMHINLDNGAVCTSGHSKNFYMIEETQISHILSQEQSTYKQVSILAPSALDAGVWATSLLIHPFLNVPSHLKIISSVKVEKV